MTTHSSILAWRIPRTEEPGGLQSMGLQESDTTEQLKPPPPCICLTDSLCCTEEANTMLSINYTTIRISFKNKKYSEKQKKKKTPRRNKSTPWQGFYKLTLLLWTVVLVGPCYRVGSSKSGKVRKWPTHAQLGRGSARIYI